MQLFHRLVKRLLLVFLFLFLAYILITLLLGVKNDWQPEEKIALKSHVSSAKNIITDSLLSFTIWNVGYGSLGGDSDFFYDDEGMLYANESMIYSPKPLTERYVEGIANLLKNNPADFFLLQEVDSLSDRSHSIPQYDKFGQLYPDYCAYFAPNYKVVNVPIPILQPWSHYGKVCSGLATYSKYQASDAMRYQLPGNYPLPDRIFQLDRCAALHRYPTSRGKDLVVINIHNSAYDPGDEIKKQQMPYLRQLALSEYEKGNYVIIGGDWNQCPPHFSKDYFVPGKAAELDESNIEADFFPEDWRYLFDATVPTNRKTKDPFEKGTTLVTLIDFFVISPNITAKKVKAIDHEFEFSDHQPVRMEVILQ